MEKPGKHLTDLLPYRVCINLDRRSERWKRMERRFSDLNLWPVERFAAVDGAMVRIPEGWPESPGAYGCLQSHLAVVLQARALNHESVLIMEDDILFDERFHEKFRERICGLPENWDMLFFGCLHSDPPTPVAAGISKLRGSFSTFMYAVRRRAYDAFIRLNSRAKQAVDRNNTILQRLFNCYCFVPHLSWVEESYSDAQEVQTNHWYIWESMVLRGKEVKAMEALTALIILYRATDERGLRNLKYVVNHFGRLFGVLVLECDKQQRLDPAALPLNCDYCFIEARVAVDKVRCLVAGFERCERGKDYFIFNEGNIVCSRMEMSANLLKCADYHIVSSFERYIDLNEFDSDRLIDGRAFRMEGYVPRSRHGRFSEYFTVTKDAFRTMISHLACPDPIKNTQVIPGLRIFESPGTALSLFPGRLQDGGR
jgi:glycosyl transferase family 25